MSLFKNGPNAYGGILPGAPTKVSSNPSPAEALGPTVHLSLLTAQMVVDQAVIKAPHFLNPSGSPVPPSELHARTSANKNIFCVEIPDPLHPATAQAINAAIKQQQKQAQETRRPTAMPPIDIPKDCPQLHLITLNVDEQTMSAVMSGFTYDPVTKRVKEIYADNIGAEGRACAEANRLGLSCGDAVVKSVPKEYKDFMISTDVQTVIGKFQQSPRVEFAANDVPQQGLASLKTHPSTAPPQITARSFAAADKQLPIHSPPPRMA